MDDRRRGSERRANGETGIALGRNETGDSWESAGSESKRAVPPARPRSRETRGASVVGGEPPGQRASMRELSPSSPPKRRDRRRSGRRQPRRRARNQAQG